MKLRSRPTQRMHAAASQSKFREVIGVSNGHEWINWDWIVCCRFCGIVRRADDQNAPCKGPARIALREVSDPRVCQNCNGGGEVARGAK